MWKITSLAAGLREQSFEIPLYTKLMFSLLDSALVAGLKHVFDEVVR
jgi:hypothetical protein